MADPDFSVNEGVPPDDAVNDKTLTEEPKDELPGENTQELSDVSENEEEGNQSTTHGGHLSTWYRRIQPLVRNKRVRYFAILNFILTLLNLVLFAVTLGVFALFIYMRVSIDTALNEDKPCIYKWSDWSHCSATCAGASIPYRTRSVLPKEVVRTRGTKYPKCPENVEKLFERVPCNTAKCPVPLSSFKEWSRCLYYDPQTMNASGCYQIRNLKQGDYYVKLDITELIRNCTDDQCPSFLP
ncbi:hypothetical protein L596_025127 [Steinernema carpocapsae]|uniref:Uncharacterized protein n=1 Tax=Steinernema carpocapsae TaxID=34508 RepID=A0A4U5M6W5_STECR|nr:hypothetical protein L596_025127 [Steinernema carpocapsae]